MREQPSAGAGVERRYVVVGEMELEGIIFENGKEVGTTTKKVRLVKEIESSDDEKVDVSQGATKKVPSASLQGVPARKI